MQQYNNFQAFDQEEDANEFATDLDNQGIYAAQSFEGNMWIIRWN